MAETRLRRASRRPPSFQEPAVPGEEAIEGDPCDLHTIEAIRQAGPVSAALAQAIGFMASIDPVLASELARRLDGIGRSIQWLTKEDRRKYSHNAEKKSTDE